MSAVPSVVADGKSRYSIVIPPPNVTAALHLGHALNVTLQDVLVRYHRMRGDTSLWIPATDHAGIATQTVVEKRLLKEGTGRLELGREAFIAKTQEWKDEYEAVIVSQLRAMGASCDWDRTRFTMDEMCATAVRYGFYRLFADGLIYRGKRLVNWDPATQTALADDEGEMEVVDGEMWYLRYPLVDGDGYVVVATTRPETMLGDTALAINPRDPRADNLRGRFVRLPIVGRIIPIIEDDYVVMAEAAAGADTGTAGNATDPKAQYATGFLKVTPAHDPNDWDIGLRHDLPVINVLGPDGSISTSHGWDDASDEAQQFVGLSREDAREEIVGWFQTNGLLEDVRPYSHSVGHSYRSHVPIEPWLSDQWFVAVTDDRLRGSALRALDPSQSRPLPEDVTARRFSEEGDGEMTFFPARYANTYFAWHESLRDWCISRQLWWGHRIPVWLRVRPVAEASAKAQAALAHSERDKAVSVTSSWTACGAVHRARRVGLVDWTACGAVHRARRVGDGLVEESVCVPSDETLRRLGPGEGVSNPTTEARLVTSLEDEGYERDPDVLDTWFSSGLWPLSTMGWPYPEDFPETVGLLESYNPTSVLVTSRDIITLWVSRMMMFNRYFLDGQLPFDEVFIHAMIQDGHGQKMSKSLGNGPDPRDIIASHGADALRFTLAQMASDTQDIRMPIELVCPHTGERFVPEYETTSAGFELAKPIQRCPSDPNLKMVSGYGLASGHAQPTDEMPLALNTSSKFDLGRNFANKVWNATRFGLQRIERQATDSKWRQVSLSADSHQTVFADRWIVARLAETLDVIDESLKRYRFNLVAEALYDFVWHDVCDRYLEAVKPTIDNNPDQQVVLGAVLDGVLRILHPVVPFVSEALWPHVQAARIGDLDGVALPPSDLIAAAAWPIVDAAIDGTLETGHFERVRPIVTAVRNIRSTHNVRPKQRVTLHAPTEISLLIERGDGMIESLAGIGRVVATAQAKAGRSAGVASFTFEGSELLVSDLLDALNLEAERKRLRKVIKVKTTQITRLELRLANPGYVNKAKPKLVAESREQLALARTDLAAAKAAMDNLGDSGNASN